MEINKDFQECKAIIEELECRFKDTNSYVSIHGSAIYGVNYLTGNGVYKPNSNSDLDLMVISEDLRFLPHLEDILDKDKLEVEMYKNNCIDVLVFRAHKGSRKISIECVKKEQYLQLCNSSKPFVIVNKKLYSKNGRIKNNYNYDIFGFISQEKNTSRIIPYNESHIIIYPNLPHLIDGSFALTVFQDQILTQIDLVGDFQDKCRRSLIDRIKTEAKLYKQPPIELFRARSVYWSEEFRNYMEDRLNGS